MAEKWGDIYSNSNSQAKLGIITDITTTNTKATVKIQVVLWPKHGVDDVNNKFYFDVGTNVTAATTLIGAKKIYVTGYYNWNEKLKTVIHTYEKTYTRGTSDVTYNVYAKFSGVEYGGGTTYVNTTFVIPKEDVYRITYDANDGTGAPGVQTCYITETAFISDKTPTRSGYTFMGWSKTKNGAYAYGPGDEYDGGTTSVTLYARWQQRTFAIRFDANGGSGGPTSITKTYGVDLKIPTDVPSLQYHNFLGWATVKHAIGACDAADVEYEPGTTFKSNASITLYAVWMLAYKPPHIYDVAADRCTADGEISEEGTYLKLSFKCKCYYDPITDTQYSLKGCSVGIDQSSYYSIKSKMTIYADENDDTVYKFDGVIEHQMDLDRVYEVRVHCRDEYETPYYETYIYDQKFPIDVLKGGNGLGFGTDADEEDVMKVAFNLKLKMGEVYKNIIDLIVPINCVKIFWTHDSPEKIYPGTTWERISECFLWATGTGAIGSTGGSKTKTLKTENLPSHSHNIPVAIETTGSITLSNSKVMYRNQNQKTSFEGTLTTATTGSGTAFDIMPPYVQVAVWRRTS